MKGLLSVLKTYRKPIGVIASILLFVHDFPGVIEDSKEWDKRLRMLAEWRWWNYALVVAGLIGLLYSTYSFFKELCKRFLTSEASKEQREVFPDCTLCEIRRKIQNFCFLYVDLLYLLVVTNKKSFL